MIYWYTGQPGHGKTLHAIDHAIDFRDKGRLVYVCNVLQFDHAKARMLPMTPEQFRDWPSFLPDGAVALVDEAYEHEMLPKRPPGSKVPEHVKLLAKHRHRGLDFIFVSQSPKKQVDEFVHDLIERHVHVRRRFGLPLVHLRTFDRFEQHPEKAHPLTLKRVKLPKRPMGLYKSTELDTTEKKIPWYYPLAALVLAGILAGTVYAAWHVTTEFSAPQGAIPAKQEKATSGAKEDGARATADAAQASTPPTPTRQSDYVAWLTPRIPSQPWTAPAYDSLHLPPQPPRVFCMAHGDPVELCTCLTEQGTRYRMDFEACVLVAREGQYEPFRDEREDDLNRADEITQRRNLEANRGAGGTPAENGPAGAAPAPEAASGAGNASDLQQPYGGFRG